MFFLITFSVYWISNRFLGIRVRNAVLLLASYVFYGYWDWRFLVLIVFSSVVDFSIGKALMKSSEGTVRKRWMLTSVILNLGLLGVFKYANFFAGGFQQLLESIGLTVSYTTLNIVLPVGISFYTFQTMSYVIDVYRREVEAETDPLNFLTFVAFFPQLVAGPIERAAHMLPQFRKALTLRPEHIRMGITFIAWGLFKKVVLADNFAILADQFFAESSTYQSIDVVLGVLCFSMQIYGDFSGYSDMALGLARLLGLEITLNFRTPYRSRSFREFWRRWHITLSTWFRDYVYIPLGGNRGKVYRNLMITFVLSGLWHGAQITFVIWGFLHGLMLILERRLSVVKRIIPPVLVIILIHLFWLPFRAESSGHLLSLVQGLNTFSGEWKMWTIIEDYGLIHLTLLAWCVLIFRYFERRIDRNDITSVLQSWGMRLMWMAYLVLSFVLLGVYDAEPNFIYFQF